MTTQVVTNWKKEWFEIEDATYLNTAAHTVMPRIYPRGRATSRTIRCVDCRAESFRVWLIFSPFRLPAYYPKSLNLLKTGDYTH